MKKFLKAALLCVCVLCFALGAAACKDGGEGNTKEPGFHYYTTQSGEKVLYEYVQQKNEDGTNRTTVEIPEDLGISKIQAGAFKGNGVIEELIVSSTVTEIAPNAFAEMSALKSITLPFTGESADAVNEKKTFAYVFGTEEYEGGEAVTQSYGSSSATYYVPKTLKNVTIEGSGEYELSAYAFHSMKTLSKVTLKGVTAIGDYAFYGCYSLADFELPASVKSIGKQAFVNCNRLNGSAGAGVSAGNGNFIIAAGSSLESIGDYAFAGTKLKTMDLSSLTKLVSLGDGAFASAIVPPVTESSGTVTELDSKLQEITLPQSLVSIPANAFLKCANLWKVVYSDGLEEIGTDAFAGCSKLQLATVSADAEKPADDESGKRGVIVLPAGMRKVWAGAFANLGDEKITYELENNADDSVLTTGWTNSKTKWANVNV